MSEPAQYTPMEIAAIRDALAGKTRDVIICPRCGGHMTSRVAGSEPFESTDYAHKRERLTCQKCHRSVLLDVKRGPEN